MLLEVQVCLREGEADNDTEAQLALRLAPNFHETLTGTKPLGVKCNTAGAS